MKIKYRYQIPLQYQGEIDYKINGLVIKVTMPDNTTDTFDFSDFLEDGQIDCNYETSLDVKAICSAKRVEGEWWIELLQFVPDGLDVCPMNDVSDWSVIDV